MRHPDASHHADPVVANILREFPVETMREGDVFCMNDPYLGGTHLPDIAVVMPVFHHGAWSR